MDTGSFGRVLIAIGIVALVVGVVTLGASGLGVRRLPGDLRFGRGNVRVYVPLATSLVVSVVATIVINLLARR